MRIPAVTRRHLLIGALATVTVAACGSSGSGEGATPRPADLDHIPTGRAGDAPPSSAAVGHPPATFDELAAIFDPIYAPMGLRITRASLVDRATYRATPTGNHLALYVEPVDDPSYSVDDYVDAIVPVTRASAPLVFGRWSALDSYDICQEPAQADDPRRDPAPVTQIELTRVAATETDWDTVSLAELIAVTLDSEGSRLAVSQVIEEHPVYAAALAEAQRLTGR